PLASRLFPYTTLFRSRPAGTQPHHPPGVRRQRTPLRRRRQPQSGTGTALAEPQGAGRGWGAGGGVWGDAYGVFPGAQIDSNPLRQLLQNSRCVILAIGHLRGFTLGLGYPGEDFVIAADVLHIVHRLTAPGIAVA